MERLDEPFGGVDETVFGPLGQDALFVLMYQEYLAVLREWGLPAGETTVDDYRRVLAHSDYIDRELRAEDLSRRPRRARGFAT